MKKLIGIVVAATLAATTLIGGVISPASAACPYGGCRPTNASVFADPKIVADGNDVRICVTVTTNGNSRPTGTVKVAVTSRKYRWTRKSALTGQRECFRTPAMQWRQTARRSGETRDERRERHKRRNRYAVVGSFNGDNKAGWQNSADRTSFRVVRK